MNIVIEMVGLVDKILQEYFGEAKFEYVDTDIENFRVVYAVHKDETLVFTYTKTAVRVVIKCPFGLEGNFTIKIPKKVNNKQKLEEILRKELDRILEVVLRRIKLKQTIKQYIEQKLYLKDFGILVAHDYGLYNHKYKANLRVFAPIFLELDIEYKWTKDKKMVSDVVVEAVKVFTHNDILRELIFNAILSYYLLS